MRLSEIAKRLSEGYYGKDVDIERIGNLETDFDNQILYIEDKKYIEKAKARNPAALIVPRGVVPGDIPFIEVDNPKLAFIRLLELFNPVAVAPGIDENALIDNKAIIGQNASIMAGAVIMSGAEIGNNCMIYPNCVIETDVSIGHNTILYSGVIIRERCIIGENCIIHSGVVIGADGFGFHDEGQDKMKIPQIGIVKIGNHVEIGANCTIDRATIDATEIGDHTKFDNLVHIAHNVKIGEKCIFAAQAGISGSVTIGNRVIILGQVGLVDHISIADDTIIMPQSGVANDMKKPNIVFGTPARPIKEHHKINAALKYLPDLLKRVRKLEEKLATSKEKD